jgi:hypothetical protein
LENCRHLDQAIWKTGFLELQNNSADVDTGEILEPQTVLDSTDLFGLPDDDAGYSPSVCTDFSGFLPRVSLDKSLDVSSNYDPEAVVRLPAEDFQASLGTWFLEPVFGSQQFSHGHAGKRVQATFACTCGTRTWKCFFS